MRLVVKQNDHLVNQIQCIKGPVYIGRHAQCQVFLRDLSVSRQHAVVFLKEDGPWMVKDLHSANKTYLNNDVIDEALLKTGDCIQVADYLIEIDLEKENVANKFVHLEDTWTSVSRGPQLITRTLDNKTAPAIRMPIQRADELDQILTKVIRAGNSSEILEMLLDVLIQQFHAGRVWCSVRFDQEGYDDEKGGRTHTGQSFDLKSDTIKKLTERACDKQQFLLLSNVKQEAVKQKAQSVIIAPIIASSGTLGVVCIESKLDRPPFTLSDLDYAMLLSISLGIILENF